jgi:hypothetical protein
MANAGRDCNTKHTTLSEYLQAPPSPSSTFCGSNLPNNLLVRSGTGSCFLSGCPEVLPRARGGRNPLAVRRKTPLISEMVARSPGPGYSQKCGRFRVEFAGSHSRKRGDQPIPHNCFGRAGRSRPGDRNLYGKLTPGRPAPNPGRGCRRSWRGTCRGFPARGPAGRRRRRC